MDAFQTWFFTFISSLSPILSEICLPKIFGNFTDAPEAIFQQNGGGACRPARPSEQVTSSGSNPASKMFWKGPYLKISICTSSFTNYTPLLCFSADFFLKPPKTLRISRRWVLSVPKWSTTVPKQNYNPFTPPLFAKYPPIFCVLYRSFSGTPRNFTDFMGTGLKCSEVVKRGLHPCKQWSPNEISVWHFVFWNMDYYDDSINDSVDMVDEINNEENEEIPPEVIE